MSARLDAVLRRARAAAGPAVFLTGAGISAESGIPTFRGPEGHWRAGSRNRRPEELATAEAFSRMPDEVWGWHLHRRGVCRRAEPNAAHRALAELERSLGDRFLLVTQNVDGLHGRAGSSTARTREIHGNLERMRCARGCRPGTWPVPEEVPADWPAGRALGDAERALLKCPACGARSRPHVLWFDECYDEENFRFQSAIDAATRASILVVVGTSGATSLPSHMVELAARRRAPLVVVNADDSPFSRLAEACGEFLRGGAGAHVPALADAIARALA